MSEPMSGMPPTPGRIVHYRLNEGRNIGQIRPAVIVRTWEDSTAVNLQVFTDSENDNLPLQLWKTSVPYNESGSMIGTWHWPKRQP